MMGWKLVNVELEDYNPSRRKWSKEITILHYESSSFAQGGIRYAYRAHDCKVKGWDDNPMVLKMHQEICSEQDVRLQAIMQAKCVQYAEEYNKCHKVSKKIQYVPCRLVRFLSGEWNGRFGTLERYIGDHFIKHNTVHPLFDGKALTERNTPQAFSHFTFEKSGKTEIVVDVQGVGDIYTDPQIYSLSRASFAAPYGMADWGVDGINTFFMNHRCNALCTALGLPLVRGQKQNDTATQPYHY